MRRQIITLQEFRDLARPTSIHLDDGEVNAYVREVEDKFVIPAIGYEVFKFVTAEDVDEVERPASLSDTFDTTIFLDGGEYTDELDSCNGRESKRKYCDGLRKAVAYFVWAKMLRADGSIITRAGAMRHREDYADHVDDSRLKQYNDVYGMGQHYLAGAMYYLKSTSVREVKPVRVSRVRIHSIGN